MILVWLSLLRGLRSYSGAQFSRKASILLFCSWIGLHAEVEREREREGKKNSTLEMFQDRVVVWR
jgi:hypothetical protein